MLCNRNSETDPCDPTQKNCKNMSNLMDRKDSQTLMDRENEVAKYGFKSASKPIYLPPLTCVRRKIGRENVIV